MNTEHILSTLREALSVSEIAHERVPVDDLFVTLEPDQVREAIKVLGDAFGISHLSTITGQDTGEAIELLYHLWGGAGPETSGHGLTLRTLLPRQSPAIHTVIDLVPGAAFYEREIVEMLDVVFEWHPVSGLLVLPDDWYGEAPLRKKINNG
jgi:NADH-quinone oxidoreductase subunit C